MNRKSATPKIPALLKRMAGDLERRFAQNRREQAVIVGVRTGGVWVAEAIRTHLKIAETVGALNIAYHRDDFGRVGTYPTVEPSHLPFAVDDRHILLVDDILYTGRTVRAALNEIFDYGRPASVTLAVLVDRGGRQLPIQADVVGLAMSLADDEHVKLAGPEPLELNIVKKTA